MNKGKWPGKLKKVASGFALAVFPSSKIRFVRHFAAEELRHVCCRIPRAPGSPAPLLWGQLALVHVYVDFSLGGTLSQAAHHAAQTLPLASVPYTGATGSGGE